MSSKRSQTNVFSPMNVDSPVPTCFKNTYSPMNVDTPPSVRKNSVKSTAQKSRLAQSSSVSRPPRPSSNKPPSTPKPPPRASAQKSTKNTDLFPGEASPRTQWNKDLQKADPIGLMQETLLDEIAMAKDASSNKSFSQLSAINQKLLDQYVMSLAERAYQKFKSEKHKTVRTLVFMKFFNDYVFDVLVKSGSSDNVQTPLVRDQLREAFSSFCDIKGNHYDENVGEILSCMGTNTNSARFSRRLKSSLESYDKDTTKALQKLVSLYEDLKVFPSVVDKINNFPSLLSIFFRAHLDKFKKLQTLIKLYKDEQKDVSVEFVDQQFVRQLELLATKMKEFEKEKRKNWQFRQEVIHILIATSRFLMMHAREDNLEKKVSLLVKDLISLGVIDTRNAKVALKRTMIKVHPDKFMGSYAKAFDKEQSVNEILNAFSFYGWPTIISQAVNSADPQKLNIS